MILHGAGFAPEDRYPSYLEILVNVSLKRDSVPVGGKLLSPN
jgi:hypothetical protein